MGKPKEITFGDQFAGITITYTKSRDAYYVSGWYDSMVGIEGGEISRAEFERQLGIPPTPPRSEGGETQ